MRDYFTAILMVIAHSCRTQAAIILGVIFFITINLVGDYYLANFQLSGQMSGLTDLIKEKLAHRYDKAAWGGYLASGGWHSSFTERIRRKLCTSFN
jgi:hypothetical protein